MVNPETLIFWALVDTVLGVKVIMVYMQIILLIVLNQNYLQIVVSVLMLAKYGVMMEMCR